MYYNVYYRILYLYFTCIIMYSVHVLHYILEYRIVNPAAGAN